jgi:hypothetical protein
MTPEFDWTDDESIVVKRQSAIAVYRNDAGDVVIRAEREWDRDEDSAVIVCAENIPALILALEKFRGQP